MLSRFCRSESDLLGLGVSFCKFLNSRDLVLLDGELGVGKTCFARAIIQSFIGEDVIVTSPTFTLLNLYEKGGTKIFHYDLYRLIDGSSIYDIEWEDARDQGICLVEWSQYIPSRELPSDYWRVEIFYHNEGRLVNINREGVLVSEQAAEDLSDDWKKFVSDYGRTGEDYVG